LFDSQDDVMQLPPEAQEELVRWCEILVADGYDLGSSTQIWESAAYLVANGHTDQISEEALNVSETAIILAFASETWPEIKSLLQEHDNGADPEWNLPNTSDLPNLQPFILLSGACFILLLAYVAKQAKQQKS
jgi:hypothetical protein